MGVDSETGASQLNLTGGGHNKIDHGFIFAAVLRLRFVKVIHNF